MEIKGKNVFISGPMSGIDANNVTAFLKAHELLVSLGAKHVYDPAYEYYSELASGRQRKGHEYYMRKCIHELSCSDAYSGFERSHWDLMVQLYDWEKSDGCITEYEVAKACGIKVVGIGEVNGNED